MKIPNILLVGVMLTSLSVAQADQILVDLVKKVKPCVVLVQTFDKDNKPIGQGSGFFIDNKGGLITNHHVIEGAYSATIKTSAGKEYPVQGIVAKDTEADIVKLVVNIPDANNLTFLNLIANVPSEGEDIVVIGNPLGLESTVSTGIVSAVRDIPVFGKIIQITAPISPGSSGSPVLNSKGEVIGIATLIATKGQNLNFAVPSDKILALKQTTKMVLLKEYNALTIDSNDAQLFYNKGLKELWQENWPAALTYFQKAKEMNPQDADAWFEVGYCYSKLGRHQDAIEACKQALMIKPDFVEAYYNLGIAYGELDHHQESIEAYEQALKVKPDYAKANINLGVTYGKLGRYQESIEAFKQAIRIEPDDVLAHYNLGLAYSKLGRHQDAIEAYKQAIRIKPDYAKAHYGLGLAYLSVDDKGSTIEEYKILKTLDAEKANQLFNLISSSGQGRTGGQSISENTNESNFIKPHLYHNPEGHFSLSLSTEWIEIPKDVIETQLKALQKQTNSTLTSNYNGGFQKNVSSYFAYPYILFQIDKSKRWPEKELKKILSSEKWKEGMKEGLRTVEEQFSKLIQNTELGQLTYDKKRNIIVIKMESEAAGVGKVIALSIIILSNYGSVDLHCYSVKDDFENDLPAFTRIIDSFRYDIGYEYDQFIKNKSSDTASVNYWGAGLTVTICVGLAILVIIIIVRKSSSKSNNCPETLQANTQPIASVPSLQIMEEDKMKKCPYCAEKIQDEAIKCRYCGKMLGIERELQKGYSNSKQQGNLLKKIIISIGVVLLIFACTILAIVFTKNENLFIKIAAFSILVSMGAIWKPQK